MARFRLGNEMRKGRYWECEERRKCRLCGEEVETWEHLWRDVEQTGERKPDRRRVLGQVEEGEE